LVYLEGVVALQRRSPRSSRVAMLAGVAVGLGACGGGERTIDVCARGDRADLAEALVGGSLELVFRSAGGRELARASAGVDRPTSLDTEVPDGAALVEISGRDRGGAEVAVGAAPIEDGHACVCLALSAQQAAACGGLRCRVTAGECRFTDEDGDPAGARTIAIGDNPDDDVAGATSDTALSDADGERDGNFGAAVRFGAASAPARTGLLRFDLTALPRTSQVERAEVQLAACGGAGCRAGGTIGLFPALEEWSEGTATGAPGCASWNCRVDGVSWSVPGCGYQSERNRSRTGAATALVDGAGPGARVTADVTELVIGWLGDPDRNRGVALVAGEEAAIDLVAREAPAGDGERPRLVVTFSLDDEGGLSDAGVDAGAADAGADAGAPPEMVAVPGGSFLMGCNREECEDDELPVHAVTLGGFEIDRTEVTQAAYALCVEAGACAEPTCGWDPVGQASYPVTCVRHGDARDYCGFAGKRLPTEAEWEKAARGVDGRRYPWGGRLPDCTLANAFGCAGKPQPVDLHPAGASPYGAVDMAGNVAEYVADFYGATYYAESPAEDPPGPATGTTRVRRGGTYIAGRDGLAAFDRVAVGANVRVDTIGFRCARDPE
jgi:formylglycine-generating enzyme required for sulfatase activity